MDKESRILLQEIDCNCNDCFFMVRDLEKQKKWSYLNKGHPKSGIINYGFCDKLKKDVSFIPNICQIETQECFEHRRRKINIKKTLK